MLALAELPSDVTYRVVGRGPDEARLRNLAQRLGVADRVTWLGRVQDLDPEYQRATLFVLPARRTSDGKSMRQKKPDDVYVEKQSL